MSEILEKLYLGRVFDSKNLKFLTSTGITHIVTVAEELAPVFPDKFTYLHIKVEDHDFFKYIPYFDQIADFIDNAITKENGAVFVHCMYGINRSATAVICYLIKYHKMTCDQAKKFTRERRRVVWPNAGFIRQLQEYELTLRLLQEQVLSTDLNTLSLKLSTVEEEKSENPESHKIIQEKQVKQLTFQTATTNAKYMITNCNFDYQCSSCGFALFKEGHVIDHVVRPVMNDDKCEMLYVNELTWAQEKNINDPKIYCPNSKCQVELGRVNMAESTCSCGLKVISIYEIKKSSVELDERWDLLCPI